MAQQTAVQFLINYMLENFHLTDYTVMVVFEQAKQMEKKQIIKALTLGYLINKDEEVSFENAEKLGEQYYNETFGGQGTDDTTSPGSSEKV